MNYTELIDAIGQARYRAACEKARREAANPEYGQLMTQASRDDVSLHEIPHEISDLIWNADLPTPIRLDLSFQVYRDMPSYALLMYLAAAYREWPPAIRQQFWERIQRLLAEPDETLSRPVEYMLWCDFYEDAELVEEAWLALVERHTDRQLLQRVLRAAGPVPFPLKRALYERLLPKREWHLAIFESLLHSQFDHFGSIDRAAASKILQQLDVAPETEGLEQLKQKLATR